MLASAGVSPVADNYREANIAGVRDLKKYYCCESSVDMTFL
jgi:hypothetical protein